MENSKTIRDAKKVFMKCGTCSRTFFHLLNREFANLNDAQERAADPLAGGLMQTGHQCGMLWGASLAAGTQSHRIYNDQSQAIASAITATQYIMNSFESKTSTHNCREITNCDLTTKFGMTKLIMKTFLGVFYFSHCFILADEWATEAIESAKQGLIKQCNAVQDCRSCASETAQKMGATEEEIIAVAGFAGGMGLSGNACGALAAAIWMKSLQWCKNHNGKSVQYFKNQDFINILNVFYKETNNEILCEKISGQRFGTIEEHSEFIKQGFCDKLINSLTKV